MTKRKVRSYKTDYSKAVEAYNRVNQALHMATLELAVFRCMAGPVDGTLFNRVAKKMETATFSNLNEFYQVAYMAAQTTQAELDALATQQGLESNGRIELASEADLKRISSHK